MTPLLSRRVTRLSLLSVALVGAAACGARTTLPDELAPRTTTATTTTTTTTSTTTGTGGMGGTGGSVSTGGTGGTGGEVTNPVVSESPDSFLQAETSTAVSPNGLVAVAWIDVLQDGSSAIGYTISPEDGKSFPPPLRINSPDGRLASDPVLAVDAAGAFYLSWVGYFQDGQGTPSDMHVYVAKAKAGALSFDAPIGVSPPMAGSEFRDKPWITVDNIGTILVTYALFTDVASKIIVSRSPDGVNWTESTVAESATSFFNLAYPCVPKNGFRIYATYLSFVNDVKVELTASDDHGATWKPLVQNLKVSLPGENVAFTDPTCVAEGNDVWVSYGITDEPMSAGEADTPRLTSIRAVRSSDGGGTIDLRLEAGDPAAAPFFLLPSLVREDGGALDVVYYAGTMDDDEKGSYRRARMVDPTLGFSPSQVIETPVTYLQARDDPRWLGDYTGLAVRGGRLYTSYVVNTSGIAHVAFARPSLF